MRPGGSRRLRARPRGGGTLLCVLASMVVGCGFEPPRADAAAEESGAERFVVDGRGVRLPLTTPRERVVSLVPSLTEVVAAVGGAGQLVGRTRFDEDPRVAGVPSVGGTVDPDVEAILDLRPDLVITWSDADARSLTERFEGFGIPVYAARARSIADFERHTIALGALLGRADEGRAVVRDVRRRLDALRVDVSEEDDRPSVLFVVWPRPLLTTGRGTFVDELIRVVGARGTFDDVRDPWPTVSFEQVLERRPDVVVVASEHAEGLVPDWIEGDPLWNALAAVRSGHVHLVDADLFNRPGPRMAEAAEELAGYVRAARSDHWTSREADAGRGGRR